MKFARIARSRGARKFVRNKLAVLGALLIGLYAAVGLSVWVFGLIPLDDTKERVLPDLHPGFGMKGSLEKRVRSSLWIVDRIQTRLDRAADRGTDPRELLDELAMAERGVADLDPDEMQELLDEGWEIYEEELEELEEIDAYAAEHPEIMDRVAAFESVAMRLQPMPSGWDGTLYRFRTILGSDSSGASVSLKTLYSVKVAFQIGFMTAIIAVTIGTLLGAAGAFWGGIVDVVVMWLVSTMSSIPYLVMLVVLISVFTGTVFDQADKPFLALTKVYVAFGLTFWIGTCRVIRGEVLKIKELEYVQAARAIGFGRWYILLRHVIPNTSHLMFINFSLLLIGAIKSEVILSFLGLGVKGQPSWGIMLAHGKEDLQNFFFWQVLSATAAMFGLVLAFNVVSDALQDAFDPKHVD